MMRTSKGAKALAFGAVIAVGLSACGGSGGSGGGTGGADGGSGIDAKGTIGDGGKGGTLTVLNQGPREHLDPQRMYIGAEILEASRLYARSLTTWAPGEEGKLVPDMATDTGKSEDGGKKWSFTLKDDVKWEDGKPVTCADLKYGVSRTFAQDQITGGPNYAISYLDIPTKKDKDGNDVPAYSGPYTKEGQDLFDKAVTCSEDNKTITYRFNKPWADFNMNTASLLAFNAFRQDKDKGAKSDFEAFSNGPYKLEGEYDPNNGGTFVRNPEWSEKTDEVRKAYPDKIVDKQGVQVDTIYERLIADSGDDQTAISGVQAQGASIARIVGDDGAKKRSLNPAAPYVDYLAPNFKSPVMKNPKVRQAFAMATSQDGYVTAYGGKQVMTPIRSMCNTTMKCHKDFNPFGAPSSGDVEGAKKLLQEAGVSTPVNVTLYYRKRGAADKAMQNMQSTWSQAGFNVNLKGISDKYYATIQAPGAVTADVFWAGWGADWPSGSTVLPALFDSRVNISSGGSGQDYGYYSNAEVNKKMDETYAITDDDQREKSWGDIDETIAKEGGYIALASQKFIFTHGSKVKNFVVNADMGGYPDLAVAAVQ